MKKFALILSILFLIILCACSATDPSSDIPDTESGRSEETATAASEETEPDTSKESVIGTKYYSITLPQSWASACQYEIIPADNGQYTLELYERRSYTKLGAGKLCSLMLFPTDDDSYKDFPRYELLASLDTGEDCFYVIALFPTDVQFTSDTMDRYYELADQLMSVLYTIQAVGDVEMAMP